MDGKDLEAEIHPLKNEDRKSQENLGTQLKNEDNLKSTPPQSQLSRCRTVAFFLSLFICLFVVFVVSFLIPCPDRPVSQRTWSVNYSAAVTYGFVAVADIDKDKVQDVLFLYRTSSSSDNSSHSCADEGFTAPCTLAVAVSGASGSMLWERPVAQDVTLVECARPQLRDNVAPSACILVGGPGPFTAFDLFTGAAMWNQPSVLGRNVSILSPVLQVPDVDSDGAPDLLVLAREDQEVGGYAYSGRTGHQIGRRGSLGMDGEGGPLLHVTRAGAHYVLLPCARSLCGCSLKGLCEKVTGAGGPFREDPQWQHMLNGTCGVLLHRKPTLGHYKPDTLAVVIENGTGLNREILLVDLGTGSVLWSQALPSLPGAPPSASLPTADLRSAFFFWGLHELVGTSQTEPGVAQHSLYMLHPSLPSVLLELASVPSQVVTFHAVLFEPSRHAACVFLTGPAHPEAPGLVSVTKHRVQDLIPTSRVVRLGQGGPDSDQAVRDRLSRLQYRNEA
ncbi:protein FAM234A isoform X2 [Tupaia chinensis]|uniref:protein FAM234A isoform X2 n=1 Tax=Tupaia chinensis TaxID=246437 RepID=UPI0007046E4D|nr:protein FAM234A isoform X2 [Tupaia chinensis]